MKRFLGLCARYLALCTIIFALCAPPAHAVQPQIGFTQSTQTVYAGTDFQVTVALYDADAWPNGAAQFSIDFNENDDIRMPGGSWEDKIYPLDAYTPDPEDPDYDPNWEEYPFRGCALTVVEVNENLRRFRITSTNAAEADCDCGTFQGRQTASLVGNAPWRLVRVTFNAPPTPGIYELNMQASAFNRFHKKSVCNLGLLQEPQLTVSTMTVRVIQKPPNIGE